MQDFFVSYNKADREWAEWIAWHLEEASYSTKIQAWDIRLGSDFIAEMDKAIIETERTIAVLSPDSLTARYPRLEWDATLAKDPSKLLPVRVKECTPVGLLATIVYLDLTGYTDEEAAKSALLNAAKVGRIKPSSPPPFPNSQTTPPESQRPRFPGSLPPIWNVPQMRNPNFTGREKILTDLHDNLNSGQRATWIHALTGLGGKGKTSLAREYSYRYRAEYDLVWWVRGSEPAILMTDYADLAKELDLPQKDSPDQNAILNAVKHWLEQNQKWLLIFDNAQEPDVVKRFLPQGGGGHVIITSRNPNWASVANRREVEVFKPKEAVEFILKRTSQNDKASAKSLAEKTGFLPLALEQAGAYIEETGVSLSDYLIRFEKCRKTTLERGKPADYPDTVATTWEISFQAVKEKSPASADLLDLCSFLAPDDIPKSLFLGSGKDLPERLASSTADEFDFDEIVAELRRYSLISGTGNKFSVHQLVQAVTRERLTEDKQKNWSEVSVRLLNNAFQFGQDDVKSWENCALLLPHALASAGYAEELGVLPETVALILNNTGLYELHLADFEESRNCFERARKIDEKAFGLDHPSVATDVNNLGVVLQNLGQMEKAKSCIERALKIEEKAFGLDHSSVAIKVNNLGMVLRDLGEMEKAKSCIERALKIDEKAFGLNHPKVAIRANNLGLVLQDLGETEMAKSCFERALKIDEKAFELDHPSVAVDVNNLGLVLQDLGETEKAKSCFERALKIDEKAFGLDHPNVATDVYNLGMVLRDLGETEKAKSCIERALKIDENAFGLDHSNVARDVNRLGLVLRDLGEIEKAKNCFEQSLRVLQNLLGEDHPRTQKAKANLDAMKSS